MVVQGAEAAGEAHAAVHAVLPGVPDPEPHTRLALTQPHRAAEVEASQAHARTLCMHKDDIRGMPHSGAWRRWGECCFGTRSHEVLFPLAWGHSAFPVLHKQSRGV